MAQQGDSGEKTEEPTFTKKQRARKQGTVAKSVDLTGALTLMAVVAILPSALGVFGAGAMDGFRRALNNMPSSLAPGEISGFTLTLLQPALLLFAVIAGTAMAVGLAASFLQVGFVLTAEPMAPKFSKINPLEGFKRLFSKRSMFEGGKTLVKGLVFGWLAYDAIQQNWVSIIRLSWVAPHEAASNVGQMIWTIAMRVAGVWLALAALDYFFQKRMVHKELMMTKDELRREMKEQEGSPEVKAARFQKMRQMSKGRMGEAVKNADVIVTNPTHFSIAIQYDRSKMHAPMVVAKGQDYLALRIRELAAEHKVPIVPNPPLARALYKQCEVGDFIPRDMFSAVAEVLAYVYRTIKKVR